MRDSPSMTAAWVAAARGLALSLPEEARLASDPFGSRFATPSIRMVTGLGLIPPIVPFVLYMQLRTRAIDDVLRAFAKEGGDQVLLLGAGFDCRAARFVEELSGATVYEVDHPATQNKKRAVLSEAQARLGKVEYVAWDFEKRPLSDLPKALADVGHDAGRRTLTIWEGVTMYLTPPAIEATVSAVRTLSAPSSPFVITYFDEELVSHPKPMQMLLSAVVTGVGEPFTFGWDPAELPGWLADRGLTLQWDKTALHLARELLPPLMAAKLDANAAHRHVALART